jgi:hypothetical protein
MNSPIKNLNDALIHVRRALPRDNQQKLLLKY